ncbi:cyanocobalamin reductase / alkylcobalamin dealkylase [Argonauta hians]
MDVTNLQVILAFVNATINPFGYEAHPFAIKCYNGIKTMDKKFHLNYPENTLALTIISQPDVMEKAIVPFICKSNIKPLMKESITDECNKFYLNPIFERYPDTDFLSSYDMLGPGHPKILSQTAAHVSGGAYYYQRRDVHDDPWPKDKKIYGVAIHPLYGGWIRILGVIVFKNHQLPSDFTCPSPKDVVQGDKLRIKLLNECNFDWESWAFADIIPVEKRYSPLAQKFYSANKDEKYKIMIDIKDKCPHNSPTNDV